MTETAIFIEDRVRQFFDLLVKLGNGKTVQTVQKFLRQKSSLLINSMGKEQVLFYNLSAEELGTISTAFVPKRKEVCKTKGVLRMWGAKLRHFYVQGVQEAVMRQTLLTVTKTWEGTVEQKKTHYTTYTSNPTLKKEHSLEESSVFARQFYMRHMWTQGCLPGGRPSPCHLFRNISS